MDNTELIDDLRSALELQETKIGELEAVRYADMTRIAELETANEMRQQEINRLIDRNGALYIRLAEDQAREKVEKAYGASGWEVVPNPLRDWAGANYRIAEEADPYAELKKAAADPTKQIRLLDECGKGKHSEWKDSGYRWHWCFPPEDYEIRDKPKPMKKVKLLAWFTGERLTWMAEEYSPLEKWRRVPIQDKVIEVEDD